MTFSIAKTADGVSITSGQTPPLVLQSDIALALAGALLSPELSQTAWKQDKLVYAPATREPVGVWVSEAGQPSIWIAGQSTDLTVEEAAELAKQLITLSAPFAVGDEVVFRVNPEKIAEVLDLTIIEGQINYTISIDDTSVEGIAAERLQAAPPVQEFKVSQYGDQEVRRTVAVQARTQSQAIQTARGVFSSMKANTWKVTGHLEARYIETDDAEPTIGSKEDLAAAEGWVYGTKNTIGRYVDADNKSVFANADEAMRFVLAEAFKGSLRHQKALTRAVA